MENVKSITTKEGITNLSRTKTEIESDSRKHDSVTLCCTYIINSSEHSQKVKQKRSLEILFLVYIINFRTVCDNN